MSGKVLLISAVLVGFLSLSSCRSLGELSEQKTYSSTPQCIFLSPYLLCYYAIIICIYHGRCGMLKNTDGSSPTPSYGSGGGYKPTPTPTPAYGSTPTPAYGSTPTPSYGTTPSTPSTPSPDVPEIPTKHDFCGSCDFWKNHPDVIIAAIGSLGNIGKTLGTACSLITGKKIENLHDALSNTGTDGTGALLREGAAAYLNSIVNKKFPFTTQQVKDCVVVAMTSDGAASSQAEISGSLILKSEPLAENSNILIFPNIPNNNSEEINYIKKTKNENKMAKIEWKMTYRKFMTRRRVTY